MRYLADQGGYHFLLVGSSSPELMKQPSESLAGRIEYLELSPLTLEETSLEAEKRHALWLRGGYPKSYLTSDDDSSYRWRNAFVQTFLERDLPQFGIRIPAPTLRRFWQMAAHFHGQIWNAQKIAQSMDISSPTSKHYLDILHHALDILSHEALLGHPSLGASWEGFAVEQIIRQAPSFSRFYFYRTAAGAEADLVEIRPDRKPILYDMRYSLSPKPTKGLRSAMQDLESDTVYLVYPGSETYPLESEITALSLLQPRPSLGQ